jgi:hypothetical protein
MNICLQVTVIRQLIRKAAERTPFGLKISEEA